jgi:hypothetical protein
MRGKMGDPHALYIVTAAVVVGLIVWVALVLSRPAVEQPTSSPDKRSSPAPGGAEVQQGDTKT